MNELEKLKIILEERKEEIEKFMLNKLEVEKEEVDLTDLDNREAFKILIDSEDQVNYSFDQGILMQTIDTLNLIHDLWSSGTS